MSSVRQLAMITGASSGIGLELARQFAMNGFDLVICADEDLAGAMAELSGLDVDIASVQADLATFAGVERLVAGATRPVDVLAVNAGFGNAGAFVDIDLDDEIDLIQTNIIAAVHLTKRLLPAMIQRRSGRVLFTSSVAATMPGPYYATYAASKSFLLSFSEALRHELKDTGVTVTALMPGPTDTHFFARAGLQDSPVDHGAKDDPAKVAEQGFAAVMAGKDHVVAGSLKNKAQTIAATVLPEPAKAAVHAKMTRPGDS